MTMRVLLVLPRFRRRRRNATPQPPRHDSNGPPSFLEHILTLQAMIDGPSTGVARQPLRYREMTLTPLKISLPLAAGTTAVKKAFDASGVAEKWANTKWAKSLQAREARKNTTDCKYFFIAQYTDLSLIHI